MVASTDALRSRQVHAVSVSVSLYPAPQFGGHQSDGQPDQADGMTLGGTPAGGLSPSMTTPDGSPGLAAGGPTVAGGTLAGSFGLGTMSSGGRIMRDSRPTATQNTAGFAAGLWAAPIAQTVARTRCVGPLANSVSPVGVSRTVASASVSSRSPVAWSWTSWPPS